MSASVKVTTSLVECNGSLPLGLWQGHLQADCLKTTKGWPGWFGLYEASSLPEQAQADLWEESSCDTEDFRLGLRGGMFLRSLEEPVELSLDSVNVFLYVVVLFFGGVI